MDHLDPFLTREPGSLLKIDFIVDRKAVNEILALVIYGNEGLEYFFIGNTQILAQGAFQFTMERPVIGNPLTVPDALELLVEFLQIGKQGGCNCYRHTLFTIERMAYTVSMKLFCTLLNTTIPKLNRMHMKTKV